MKIKITTIVLLCISTLCFGFNLDSIPQIERDSILKQLARTTVLLYGSDYYRDGQVIIEQKNAESDIDAINYVRDAIKKRNNPIFYSVTTYYNQTKELFSETYVSKVNIWAVDPLPFEIRFGNRWGTLLDETLGKQVQEISTKFDSHGDSTVIIMEGRKKGIIKMNYETYSLQKLPQIMNSRKQRDSISFKMKLQKKLELEQQLSFGSTFNKNDWKKLFKADRKSILDVIKKTSDQFGSILKRDIKYLNTASSTEYNHFNTVKHFYKFKKRIVFPTFVVDEKKISNLKDKSSVISNMHYSPNDVNVYIGNRKYVFYRITWKKTNEKWEYQGCESIPLSHSNKLIQSGLYKNRKKAETLVLQQDGKVKNLVFFKKRKKMTFLDSKNFLNDYQSTIPNLK